ncbi:MAG: tRNA 2-thiouridine(34) synthase MnmA [Bacteroidetes bacterium]|nr:tRNA 2-thiouridine(34) synthase MnmA [Bacteroidota bacterium]
MHTFIKKFIVSNGKRVIVGLSGGVDSSVAAYLLQQQGYEVTGVTMSLWNGEYTSTGKHACYGPDEKEEIREARELAAILRIPYHVFDCSDRYKQLILENFRQEYLSGRTPNPCVKCNQLIKFGMLPELATHEGIGFEYFATGHYARVEFNAVSGRYLLKKGLDTKKDQSYFIFRLDQGQLSKALFPLGELTKQQVRELAAGIDLPLSDKEESQDFYSGNYQELLGVDDFPGDIVNLKGAILGAHKGIWNYTIGQRKGLGVAWTEPLYVISLDTIRNRVIVGTREEVMGSEFIVNDLNWIAIEHLEQPMEVKARIRSAQKEADAIVEPYLNGSVKVTFHQPNDGITPGQSAVFYQDDLVIGGGTILSV